MKKNFITIFLNIFAVFSLSQSFNAQTTNQNQGFSPNLTLGLTVNPVRTEKEILIGQMNSQIKSSETIVFLEKIYGLLPRPLILLATIFKNVEIHSINLSQIKGLTLDDISLCLTQVPPITWGFLIFVFGIFGFFRPQKEFLDHAIKKIKHIKNYFPIVERFFNTWEEKFKNSSKKEHLLLQVKFCKKLDSLYQKIFLTC